MEIPAEYYVKQVSIDINGRTYDLHFKFDRQFASDFLYASLKSEKLNILTSLDVTAQTGQDKLELRIYFDKRKEVEV